MPILRRIKVMLPKSVVKNETFSPAASIPELTPPKTSIASKAVINPIIEPKKPITRPKMLTSDANFSILFVFSLSFFRLRKPLTKKKIASNRQIKISDIKKGPPSINLSVKTFNSIIIKYV